MKKLPSDLLIFSPEMFRKPLCIQYFAIRAWPKALRLCAISFSWCGKMRSRPPAWMSKVSPRCLALIAEHSMCQPGRPRPHGLAQPGWPSVEGFHSTKSAGSFL